MMELISLEKICHKITDGSHNPPKGLSEGLLMLSSRNITNNGLTLDNARYLNQEDFIRENKRTDVNPGDVLMTIVGTIGRVLVVKESHPKFTLQRSVGVLKPIHEKLDSIFLAYALKSKGLQRKLSEGAKGVAQKGIYLKDIGKLKIPLPPLPQQKKIAAILDAADAYRQKTKSLIGKYDELTQSLFLDMFGDPVRNEKGWEMKNLKDISSRIHSGNTPKGGSKVYVKEGITFFRSQNVWKNRIIYDDVAFIDQATQDKMLKSSLKHGDILMTKTGRINTENSSLGRAAMYLGEDDQANVNGHVYLIRLNKDVLNEFVLHILTTKQYRDHIRRVCVGGIDKRQLNKNHLEEFPIIYPPIKMQEKFLESLLIMQSHKVKLETSLAKAEDLFDSLLQKAFKGELVL